MLYNLRCVFEYAKDIPTWKSQWNRSGDNATDSAFMQTKNGLLYAVIEGKNIITKEIVRIVEYPGYDFCNFQWVAASFVPVNSPKGQLQSKLIGLALVTRDNVVTVFRDGSVKIDQRNAQIEDKHMHYAR
jgi:hypothetical protein